jgi:hypothetical protein
MQRGPGSVVGSRSTGTEPTISAGWRWSGGPDDLAGGQASTPSWSGRGAGTSVSGLWPLLARRWSRRVRHLVPSQRGRPLLRSVRRRGGSVICDGCGLQAAALKSVVLRADRSHEGCLCDACWYPVRDRVWIVPGPVPAHGRCSGCGEWVSVNDLEDLRQGAAGRGDAPGGTCSLCGQEVRVGG